MTAEMIGQCEKHELPLDDHGECQLCRLGDMAAPAQTSRRGNWVWMMLVAALLGGVTWAIASFEAAEATLPARGVAGSAARVAAPAPIDRAPLELEPIETQPVVADAPSEIPEPVNGATGQALAWSQAREKVQIRMYVTPSCETCKQARDYMTHNEIAFTELDITADEDADRRLRELRPERPTPFFELDGIVFVGFKADRFEAARTQAAREHFPANND